MKEKITELQNKIDSILEALKEASEIRKNNTSILNNNFELLDKKISSLHADTNQNFEEVKFELVKLQKTTKYDELYENLKIVNKK